MPEKTVPGSEAADGSPGDKHAYLLQGREWRGKGLRYKIPVDTQSISVRGTGEEEQMFPARLPEGGGSR